METLVLPDNLRPFTMLIYLFYYVCYYVHCKLSEIKLLLLLLEKYLHPTAFCECNYLSTPQILVAGVKCFIYIKHFHNWLILVTSQNSNSHMFYVILLMHVTVIVVLGVDWNKTCMWLLNVKVNLETFKFHRNFSKIDLLGAPNDISHWEPLMWWSICTASQDIQ